MFILKAVNSALLSPCMIIISNSNTGTLIIKEICHSTWRVEAYVETQVLGNPPIYWSVVLTQLSSETALCHNDNYLQLLE